MSRIPTCTATGERTMPHKLPTKLKEIVRVNIISIDKKTLLCIVDYYRKVPVMQRANGLSADDLIRPTKVVFSGFMLQRKILYEAGTNFMSEGFKQFCRQLNIKQTITSLNHHQSNCQVEA